MSKMGMLYNDPATMTGINEVLFNSAVNEFKASKNFRPANFRWTNGMGYNSGILSILNDRSKFKLLEEYPALLREERLQRLLRELKNNGYFDENVYDSLYPTG